MQLSSVGHHLLRLALLLLLLVLFAAPLAQAQSTDVRFPSAVEGNEISGSIPARDIGDARLTDHFYTFNGLPGDLLITVQSENLNGDFDVFTAAELRPVMKVTVYAESSIPITKSIYLRKPESFILRIEARSPNDDKGSYRIRLSGSFLASATSPASDSSPATDEKSSDAGRPGNRKTTRVTSSGARIYEPPVEVAKAPIPEPTPAATEEAAASAPPKNTSRTLRGRRVPPRKPAPKSTTTSDKSEATLKKTSPAETAKEPAKESAATDTTATDATRTEAATPDTKRAPGRRTTARSNRAPAVVPKPKSPPENTARLLIEVKDGPQLEYLMSTVRRVTVENGQIVIVGNDGHIKRVPMTTVVRMSIGP